MANDKRPNPAADQQERLDNAMRSAGAEAARGSLKGIDRASLDVFNAKPQESAASAAADRLSLRQDDENGLNEFGSRSEDAGGTRELGTDEPTHAQEASESIREDRRPGEDRDGDGTTDQGGTTDPFDFVSPGRARIVQEMAGLLPQDDTGGQSAGTAAGQQSPGSSGGGDGSISSGSGGGSGGNDSSVSSGRGGMGASNAVNPITGQGMGVNAYGTPGTPDLGNMGSAAGAGIPADPFVDLMMSTTQRDQGQTTPSVAEDDAAGEGIIDAVAKSLLAAAAAAGTAGAAPVAGVLTVAAGVLEATNAIDNATGGALSDPDRTNQDKRVDTILDAYVERELDKRTGFSEGAPQSQTEFFFPALDGQSIEPDEDHPNGVRYISPRDQVGPDGENSGPPTQEEIAFRSSLRLMLNYHGSPGHNEGDSTPTDEPTAIPSGSVSMTQSRDTARALFGQPAEDGPSSRGGPARIGNLPGDDGAIDYGPDSTGAHTSNAITEQESEALDGFGGSGLSIYDARRESEEEDEEDED